MDAEFQLVHFERLFEVVKSAILHRLDRGADRAVAGDDDDHRRRCQLARFADDFQAVRPCLVEVKVGDHQLGQVRGHRSGRGMAAGEGKDFMSFLAQQFSNHLHHGQFVIYQKHSGHRSKANRLTVAGANPKSGLPYGHPGLFGFNLSGAELACG